MKILVTGCAGFIGYYVTRQLLDEGHQVIGIDNLNSYYSPVLKRDRLAQLDSHNQVKHFTFLELDIIDHAAILRVFEIHQPQRVVHLAAQAGVRHSLTAPHSYIDANIRGFLNILEACRFHPIEHLVYASSSSVYGNNTAIPFHTTDRTDAPASLYAATKKANELMAHSYSHLFGIPSTGLRFFTVYGPWGRPDMAPMLFANAIMKGKPIQVFNQGQMRRDFTYVGDIANLTIQTLWKAPSQNVAQVFNIGRGEPIDLMEFIRLLENALGKKAALEFLGMQPGDVPVTWANTDSLAEWTGVRPEVSLADGVQRFADWYLNYPAVSNF